MRPPLSPIGAAALRLITEHAVRVFPLVPRSKRPMVGKVKADGSKWNRDVDDLADIACDGGFYRASSHPEAIADWWTREPQANLAVRLGGALRLALVEGDSPAANVRLEAMAADWPTTWAWRASRGINRLFCLPLDVVEHPKRDLFVSEIGTGFECKSGDSSCTLPPSVHENSHVYAWLTGCSPDDIEPAPMPADLVAAIRQHDADAAALDAAKRAGDGAHRTVTYDDCVDLARVADALRYLDATDFQTWIDCGLALKSIGDPRARGVWDAWSSTSEKYSVREQDRQWRAMLPKAITVASIFHHAKRAGWSPTSCRTAA